MNMSIDNRYCNRFIHIRRPIFSVNRSSASVYNPNDFGNAHARCYTREAPLIQSATQVGSSQLDSSMLWLFREAITSPIIVFTSIPTCFAGTNSIAIDLITVKDRFFFLSIGHQPGATSDNPAAISSCCDQQLGAVANFDDRTYRQIWGPNVNNNIFILTHEYSSTGFK